MGSSPKNQQQIPIIKLAQYLTNLTVQQDIWEQAGKAMVTFFNADLVAFANRIMDDDLILKSWTTADPDEADPPTKLIQNLKTAISRRDHIGEEILNAVADTLESGFLTSIQINTPDPMALAFLPIAQENQITAVMLVAHLSDSPIPHEQLECYLAVAGLIGTTAGRLSSEKELRKHRQHLEILVKDRTEALSKTNTQLEKEISERKKAEARVEHLNQVLRSINNVNQLIFREKDPIRMVDDACQLLVENRGYHNVWIALINNTGKPVKISHAGMDKDFPQFETQLLNGSLPNCTQKALDQKGVTVIETPLSTCIDCPLSINYSGRGGMTIRLEHNQKIYGWLCTSIPTYFIHDAEEQILLKEIANDIAFALYNIEMEALTASEAERNASILESISDAFLALDNELIVTYFNDAAERTLGRSRSEVIGKPLFDAFPEARGSIFEERYRNVFASGKSDSFEVYFDAEPYANWYGVRVYPQPNGISVYFQVITERKQAEARERKFATRLQLAMENASEGIWEWDFSTGLVTFDEMALRMLGYETDFLPQPGEWWFSRIHPEDFSCVEKTFNAYLSGEIEKYSVEFRLRRKDDDYSWVASTAEITQTASDGQPLEVIGIHRDITESKLAEQMLKASEERNRLLLEYAGVGIGYYDLQGNCILMNRKACEDMKAEPKEVIGQHAIDLFGDWMGNLILDRIGQVLNSNKTLSYEDQVEMQIGPRWYYSTYSRIYDGDGRITGVQIISDDITNLKRAERNLSDRERFLSTLMDAIPIPVFYKDQHGRYQGCNSAFESFFGSTKEQIIGKTVFEINPKQLAEIYHAKDKELFESGGVQQYEGQIKNAQGSTRDVIFHKSIFTDSRGEISGLIGGILDITDRKQTEVKINQQNKFLAALQEITLELISQLNLNTLLENIVTRAGQIMGTNSGFLDLVNPENNKLVPRIGIGALAESLEHIAQPGEGLAGTIWQSGKPLIINNYDQWSNRISKFSNNSISSIIGVPLLSGKEVIGVLGLAHEVDSNKTFENQDIEYLSQFARLVTLAIQNAQLYSVLQQELAERKKTEFLLQNYMERLEEIVAERTLELEETQEQLVRQERLAAIGQLAGSIGHELRNPLGVITNVIYYLRLILEDSPENILENLNLIEAEAQRASKIISDLLDFARLKSVNHSPAKLPELVNEVLSQNHPPGDINVTINFPDGMPDVLVDAGQINQVLTNLVTNAYQAMPQGGQLIIDLDEASSVDSKHPMLAVRIQDTGIGIAPEHMKKIFEPLFTTKTSGIGLGLPLSLKLMEANGGTIRATNTPGKNTTFTLYFPIRKDPP